MDIQFYKYFVPWISNYGLQHRDKGIYTWPCIMYIGSCHQSKLSLKWKYIQCMNSPLPTQESQYIYILHLLLPFLHPTLLFFLMFYIFFLVLFRNFLYSSSSFTFFYFFYSVYVFLILNYYFSLLFCNIQLFFFLFNLHRSFSFFFSEIWPFEQFLPQ